MSTPAPKPAIIRLPPTSMDRKRAYVKQAGVEGFGLTEWIWRTLDHAAGYDYTPEAPCTVRLEDLP